MKEIYLITKLNTWFCCTKLLLNDTLWQFESFDYDQNNDKALFNYNFV